MASIHAEASEIIHASPERVYAVLADYHEGHPRILPPEFFSRLEVEQGGRGAGTVIRVHARGFGKEQVYHLVVSEPEPGRVLVEEDAEAGVVTTFTVTPVDGGRQSRVRIRTEWQPKPGLAGLVERLLNPAVAPLVFRKELRRLAELLLAEDGADTPSMPAT